MRQNWKIKLKIKIQIVLTFLISTSAFSQVGISAGTIIGASSFNSNSPAVGGFAAGVFVETDTPLFEEVFPRLGLIFMKDINAMLPNNRKSYYPSMLGLNFKGVTSQYFDSKIFLEEGIGLLALNDKTFIDKNYWEFGLALSFLAGLDMRDFNLRGLKTGAAVEYGFTFTGSLPSYLNFYLQFHYTF